MRSTEIPPRETNMLTLFLFDQNVFVRQREQTLITARADASEKAGHTSTPHIPPTKLLDVAKGPTLTSTALASSAASRKVPPQLDFRTASSAMTPAPLAPKLGSEEPSLALSKPPAQVWSDMNEKERQIWRQKKEREARTGGNTFLNFGGAGMGQRERKK